MKIDLYIKYLLIIIFIVPVVQSCNQKKTEKNIDINEYKFQCITKANEKDYQEALKYCKALYEADKMDLDAVLTLAKIYKEQKNYEQANKYIKIIIEKDNIENDDPLSSSEAYILLGEMNEEKGNKDQSITYYKKVIEINPLNEEIKKRLERLKN